MHFGPCKLSMQIATALIMHRWYSMICVEVIVSLSTGKCAQSESLQDPQWIRPTWWYHWPGSMLTAPLLAVLQKEGQKHETKGNILEKAGNVLHSDKLKAKGAVQPRTA